MNWTLLSTKKTSSVYYRFIFNLCFFCHIKSKTLICHNCLNGLELNTTHCQSCKLPTPTTLKSCGICQKKPPRYHTLIAPYLYKGTIKALIRKLKFNQARHHTQPLCDLLAKELISHYKQVESLEPENKASQENNALWPSTLIYVPSHNERIRERGFCHMRILATVLVEKLPNHIEINNKLLIKKIHNSAQHTQNKKKRLQIKSNTFLVNGPIPEHIAILDDVITTGATIDACVKALHKAGAKRIDVWAFARTPLFETDNPTQRHV